MLQSRPSGQKSPDCRLFCPLPRCGRSDHAIEGKIHSLESLGVVDGPGIRAVVFMQGCRLRCRYCHNPDTWALTGGETIAPATLVVSSSSAFFPTMSGAAAAFTFSGGEPLLQPEFLAEALRLCKEAGISTCLDTAGVGYGEYADILRYTRPGALRCKALHPGGLPGDYRSTHGGNPSLCGRCAQRECSHVGPACGGAWNHGQ